MKQLGVYLAGPISGLTYEDATGWRDNPAFHDDLALAGWTPLSPMEGYEWLSGNDKPLSVHFEDAAHPGAAAEAVRDDLAAIDAAKAVLCNFSGASRASIGTCAELGYAFARGKAVISVLPTGDTVHDHPFVTNLSYRVVETLPGAVAELARLHADMTRVPYA